MKDQTAHLKLEKDINGCKLCNLCYNRDKPAIWRGSLYAKIMVIGEAPGWNEDKLGVPFVGDSGELLDKMLISIGLSSDDFGQIYITNAIKCRPQDNRTPTANEIQKCQPWLTTQINLLHPKILVAVGNTALKSLGVKGKVSSLVGANKIIYYKGLYNIPVISLFHPAYLLRNPELIEGSPKWYNLLSLLTLKNLLQTLDSNENKKD